jgi:hypothetical protein
MSSVEWRRELRDAIADILSSSAQSRVWMQTHRHLHLMDFFSVIVPAPPDHGADADVLMRHQTLCIVGALTASQASAAARHLGLADPAESRRMLMRVRLQCLTHVREMYTHIQSHQQ